MLSRLVCVHQQVTGQADGHHTWLAKHGQVYGQLPDSTL